MGLCAYECTCGIDADARSAEAEQNHKPEDFSRCLTNYVGCQNRLCWGIIYIHCKIGDTIPTLQKNSIYSLDFKKDKGTYMPQIMLCFLPDGSTGLR